MPKESTDIAGASGILAGLDPNTQPPNQDAPMLTAVVILAVLCVVLVVILVGESVHHREEIERLTEQRDNATGNFHRCDEELHRVRCDARTLKERNTRLAQEMEHLVEFASTVRTAQHQLTQGQED